MREQRKNLPVIIGFLVLSFVVFLLSKVSFFYNLNTFLESMTSPVRRSAFVLFQKDENSEITKLKNENRELRSMLMKQKDLEKDNQALRDQFIVTKPIPKILLPASMIGAPTFLPGVTSVDKIYIDKGNANKIKKGDKVVFKDNLLGRIDKISPGVSAVELVNNKDFSITAKTLKTEAIGIVKGNGDKNMLLGNVSATDTLQVGDTVVTNDNYSMVIGKIISVNKKASSLFQTAKVESLINVTKLKIVFVLISD